MNAIVVANIATGEQILMTRGHEYVITYRIGTQRFDRRARMSLLGGDKNSLQFNARPFAGTQEFPPRVITSVTDVGLSKGREDSDRYVGEDARQPHKERK